MFLNMGVILGYFKHWVIFKCFEKFGNFLMFEP